VVPLSAASALPWGYTFVGDSSCSSVSPAFKLLVYLVSPHPSSCRLPGWNLLQQYSPAAADQRRLANPEMSSSYVVAVPCS
jgi:hypothetical protein